MKYRIMKHIRGTVHASRALGCSIGDNCRILSDIATSEPWLVTVGDRVTVSSGVRFITHDGTGWLYRDEKGRRYRYAPVRIGSDVFIGANVLVLPGVTIGDRCVIGAGSVVTRSVPDGTVVAGNPAHPLGSWDDLQVRLESWPSDTEMAGATYRERVDSIAEKPPAEL
ncbi:MAG TPA: acyltransferase [Glaciibacter sp.]|nr:acyltransferase [Glaciibacter sp.]